MSWTRVAARVTCRTWEGERVYFSEMRASDTTVESHEPQYHGSELPPRIEVRVTRYDRQRLRMTQALVPTAFLLLTLAKVFDSLLALLFLLVLAGACLWLPSARTHDRGPARVLPGGIKLARSMIHPGEFGRWRWRGKRAIVFALQGNLSVVAQSTAETDSLRLMLKSALGDPLRYRRRGSVRARQIAGATGLAGAGLMSVAFSFDIKPLWLLAISMLLGGLVLFGALSQAVAAPGTQGTLER